MQSEFDWERITQEARDDTDREVCEARLAAGEGMLVREGLEAQLREKGGPGWFHSCEQGHRCHRGSRNDRTRVERDDDRAFDSIRARPSIGSGLRIESRIAETGERNAEGNPNRARIQFVFNSCKFQFTRDESLAKNEQFSYESRSRKDRVVARWSIERARHARGNSMGSFHGQCNHASRARKEREAVLIAITE